MGNFITGTVVFETKPTCANRDGDNQQKNTFIFDNLRAILTSANTKVGIRREMGIEEIRTKQLQDCIEKILLHEKELRGYDDKIYEDLGNKLCDVLGCDWSKKLWQLEAKKNNDNNKSNNDEENNGNGNGKEKGVAIIVTNVLEIATVVTAFFDYIDGLNGKKYDKKACVKKVEEALSGIRLSLNKAFFGNMNAKSVLATTPGAVHISVATSLNEYIPTDDFGVGQHILPKEDPDNTVSFYESFQEFFNQERQRDGSDAMFNTCMSTNLFMQDAAVDMDLLSSNLRKNPVGSVCEAADDNYVLEIEKEYVPKFFEKFAVTRSEAKQNSMMSEVPPVILYVESILDGRPGFTPIGETLYAEEGRPITEQAVEKILVFAQDDAFRVGDINRYVVLSGPYKAKYAEQFEAIGVKVLKNLTELKEKLESEIERVS